MLPPVTLPVANTNPSVFKLPPTMLAFAVTVFDDKLSTVKLPLVVRLPVTLTLPVILFIVLFKILLIFYQTIVDVISVIIRAFNLYYSTAFY